MRLYQWHKLCLTAWLFLLFFFAAVQMAAAAQTATVNTTALNVRAEAAVTAERITQIVQGQQFPLLKTSGEWAQIRLTDGQSGWVLLKYVQVTVLSDLPKSVTVSGNSVNVRSGPGTAFAVSGGVSKGAILPVLALENGWYKVKVTAEISGWVSADYVTAPGSTAAAVSNQPAEPAAPAAPSENDASPAAVQTDNGAPTVIPTAVPSTEAQAPAVASVADNRLKGLVVNASALNVRQGPSLTAKIITTVPQGTRMIYLGKSADWYQVTMDDNRQGWVSSSLVSFSTEAVSSWISPKPKAPKKAEKEEADPDENEPDDDDEDTEDAENGEVDSDRDDEGDNEPGIAGKTIVIDPGHGTVQSGWYDPGAIGPGGTQEADVVMDIAERLAKLLDDAGADVVLTREGQTNLTLDGRTRIANELQADVFISIHANASTSSQLNGTTTYYYLTPVSGDAEQVTCRKILASSLQEALVDQLERPDLGIRQENFAVLRTSKVPSALVETAFISNATEEELLKDSSFRRAAARGIFTGLEAYFQEIY